jgi:hypothetical protein
MPKQPPEVFATLGIAGLLGWHYHVEDNDDPDKQRTELRWEEDEIDQGRKIEDRELGYDTIILQLGHLHASHH